MRAALPGRRPALGALPIQPDLLRLPLWQAYGVFSALQLGLAAVGHVLFARALGQRRAGAVIAAVAYAFSGFYIVSVNFTMMIAAAAWLPLILAMIEVIIRKQEQKGRAAYSPVPYVAGGALFLGMQTLAGHVEITYYVAARQRASGPRGGWPARGGAWATWRPLLRLALWLVVMVGLGLALGAVQIIPLYDLVSQSFREGSASLQQVRDWAWPSRQIVTFLLPDFFGNPTHHAYFDIWRRAWTPVTQNALGEPINTIDWGVKNYVEGANYLGLLTLALAEWRPDRGDAGCGRLRGARAVRAAGLRRDAGGWANTQTLTSSASPSWLCCRCFSLSARPLYALPFYLLPGYNQLHSAFRWVFPYTLSMAALAGFGICALLEAQAAPRAGPPAARHGWASLIGLAGLLAARQLAVVAAQHVRARPFVAIGGRILAVIGSGPRQRLCRRRDGVELRGRHAGEVRGDGAADRRGAVVGGAGDRGRGDRGGRETRRGGASTARSPPCHLARPTAPPRRWPPSPCCIPDLWLFGHGFNPADRSSAAGVQAAGDRMAASAA